MTPRAMEVVKPGMFSTFQDLGRVGWQHLGVPVSGAMDEVSHRLANLLVGNGEHEATLEITLMGPTLRFERAVTVCVAGADLGAAVLPASGVAPMRLPLNLPARLAAGAILQFGKRSAGLRGYVAVEGGFGLTPVMGSGSTHVRGALGGFEGRALRKGDRVLLPVADDSRVATPGPMPLAEMPGKALQRLLASLRPDAGVDRGGDPAPTRIRAMRGREWSQFSGAAQKAFFGEAFVVDAQSERMGYRLQGPMLERAVSGEMLSEAVAFGTVQVPSDGMPIVLMADRQSTGGYARIAQVASVDLPRLAQVMPGESIRFELIEIEAAQQLLVQRSKHMEALRSALRETGRTASRRKVSEKGSDE